MVRASPALKKPSLDQLGCPAEQLPIGGTELVEKDAQGGDAAFAASEQDLPSALGDVDPLRPTVAWLGIACHETIALETGDDASHGRGGDALVARQLADR